MDLHSSDHSCTVSGQVASTSADAEAILNAGISSHNAKQIKTEQDRIDSEPPHKRQVLDVDFTSIVKEAVYNSQQVPHSIPL